MSDEEAPRRSRGRPRRAGADEEILGVALAMLRESGYRNLSIDAIAERAGVAKTTIYRRWPSKGTLIAAALATTDDARDASLRELLGEPEGELVDVLRAILEPRHRELGGGEAADRAIGVLLAKYLLRDEDVE